MCTLAGRADHVMRTRRRISPLPAAAMEEYAAVRADAGLGWLAPTLVGVVYLFLEQAVVALDLVESCEAAAHGKSPCGYRRPS